MSSTITHLAQVLASELGVDTGYRHAPKQVTPGQPLATDGALFKWYALHPAALPVPDEVSALARTALIGTEARGLGLVILHRCGADFYFLIGCTWRNNNELWETVLYKDASMAAFAPFPRDEAHKPTFCVWELMPVWHEQLVWARFLGSARDQAAAQLWLGDQYAGPA